MSDLEGELAPELEVDDADLLEQATPVPNDDDEDYPFGPEDNEVDNEGDNEADNGGGREEFDETDEEEV